MGASEISRRATGAPACVAADGYQAPRHRRDSVSEGHGTHVPVLFHGFFGDGIRKGPVRVLSDSSDAAASSPMMSGRVASVCASFTKTTPSFDTSSLKVAPRGDAPGRWPTPRFRAAFWSKSSGLPRRQAA